MMLTILFLILNVFFAMLMLNLGEPILALINLAAAIFLAVKLTYDFHEDSHQDKTGKGSDNDNV